MIHRLLLWSAASALLLPLSLVGIAYASAADASIAHVASPAVSGPVTGGNGVPVLFGHTAFDLASVGYAQSEFFVAGTADAFTPTATLTTDGRWTIACAMPTRWR